MHEREREVEAALHAAGVAAHLPVGGLFQPDALQKLLPPPFALLARDPVQRALQVQVLSARQERVEGGLLQRGPDGSANLRTLLDDVVAGHRGPAARRREERRQHQDGGGLTRAVGAEEPVNLTRFDAQVYAVHGAWTLLELPDEVLDLYPPLLAH